MYFNTIKKLTITILVLCVYSLSRLIMMPGITTISSIEFEHTEWIFFIETLNGNFLNKYNIFGVGITPLITFLLVFQTYSILYRMFYSDEFKVKNHHYIIYIPVISIIESYFYSRQLILFETHSCIVSLYHNEVYFYLTLTLLVVGSLLVCLFVFFINRYGLGKGFTFILLINFGYSFFSSVMQLELKAYNSCYILLLVQCLLCSFLFYRLNSSLILIPVISYSPILKYDSIEDRNEYSIFFYNFLSIVPFILVDFILPREYPATLYKAVGTSFLQSIVIFITIVIFSRFFKRLMKYRERRSNLLRPFSNEYTRNISFAGKVTYNSILFDFLYLFVLVLVSRMDIFFHFFLELFMGYIKEHPIDTIHGSSIFLFVLLVRMFLFVLDRTDSYVLK